MIGVKLLGTRLCRRRYTVTHWPLTIGRVFAVTRFWFMVAFAAKLVSGYADPPPLAGADRHRAVHDRVGDAGRAVGARVRLRHRRASRRGRRSGLVRVGGRYHPHPGIGDDLRHRVRPDPRQSRRERDRAGRRSRHRRHRHRPRRQGHLRRSLLGAVRSSSTGRSSAATRSSGIRRSGRSRRSVSRRRACDR